MTMKFDTPGQAARLNAKFDQLTEDEKEAVLRMSTRARAKSGVQTERLSDDDGEAYARKRPGDGKIEWGVGYRNKKTIRGVFP